MAIKWPPSKDAELAAYTPQFSAKITANPIQYGLVAADATAFATVSTTWVNAYNLASDPSTRTKSTVAAKDQARASVVASLRALNKKVQAANVTAALKEALGVPVRDTEPSPSHAPTFTPGVVVLSVFGRTARTRLFDPANPTRRGKPEGCAAAQVFSYVGDEPPADLSAWTSEGVTSRTSMDITFPTSVAPGAQVWITARWLGPKFQNGPTATPVMTNLPGGAAQAA